MSRWMEKLAGQKVSRRDFLKGSAAATAAVAGLTLVGRQNVAKAEEAAGADAEMSMEHTPITDPEEGGKWVGAACWHNCGGRCMNKVMVKDGMVIRQKGDDTHEDSRDYPQQRGCVRGRAQQQQCFGADRIKYPMKRKNWNPGEPNGELRGKDEWERISWDEAIKYVADEFLRIKEAYGNQAFLCGSWTSVDECPPLLAIGGHTSITDSTSYGTYLLNIGQTIGWGGSGFNTGNDRLDLLKADYAVCLSLNTAWSAPGTPINNYVRAKEEAGVKFITIDPMYTATAQVLDADWVPVRTGTDTALLLGVASEMLRLDEEEGDIIDWEFLDKYTVGFDADHVDHMPEDNKVNFRDYLEGKYDDVPKTAEWASNICGAPVEQITMLARTLGKKNNVWFIYSFASSRNAGAENLPQLVMTIGAMGGHMGKEGNCTTLSYTANSANQGSSLVRAGSSGAPWLFENTAFETGEAGIIPGPKAWEAVFTGKYRDIGEYYGRGMHEGKDFECDIHCIVNMEEHAYLQSGPNIKKGIEAYRKVDFTVFQGHFMTTPAKYSDIILPATTRWEWAGNLYGTNREFLFCASQVIEPLYEAKHDDDIYKMLIDAMGLDGKMYYPLSQKAQFFNQLRGAKVIKEDGSDYETLITITQEDIDEWGVAEELAENGFEVAPQEGRVGLQEFIDNGGYQVPRHEGDAFGNIGMKSYFDDPEANPRGSASGKFEITSQAKADLFNSFGLVDWDYKAYPEYIVPVRGYETTFKDGVIGGEKGEFPTLLYDIHYMRRSHSSFDNLPWLREAWPNPVFMSAADAKEAGIESGDTVKISTPFASGLRKACVMQGMMPGVAAIPHGSWVNWDEDLDLDFGGAENWLEGNEITGGGITPYNNKNCKIEKYDGEPLEDDWKVSNSVVPSFE